MGQTILESRDAAECRRLAELLHLDAVGIVRRRGDGSRRIAWWAAPDVDVAPLERILDGTAADWITCPRGEDLVFAHLTDGSEVRSVSTLGAMLTSLAGDGAATEGPEVATEDPSVRDRTRLAYAIHDGLTQVVTASILELEWQARRADVTPGDAVESLTFAASELRKALDEIRSVLASLSPHAHAEQPLEALVEGLFERWHLPATWSVDGDLNAVPRPILEVASAVIRESVANAAKHAASRDVSVAVRASRGTVEVRVEDQGKGFQPAANGERTGHLGLEMMRSRVAAVNGTLDIESSPGQGTRVVARLPVMEQGVKP